MSRIRREDGEKKRGGCVMAVVIRIALQHPQWLDPPGNQKVVCFQLFPSEVSRRFDEVTAHIGDVTGGHSFISSTKSFFGISYRHLSMPKDLTLSKNKCLSTSFTR